MINMITEAIEKIKLEVSPEDYIRANRGLSNC